MNVDLNDYPFAPSPGKTDTSAAAAREMACVTGAIIRTVYLAISERGSLGLTSDELAERVQMERSTVQPRTSELKALGLIIDSGQRRLNRNGKRAIVWVLDPGDTSERAARGSTRARDRARYIPGPYGKCSCGFGSGHEATARTASVEGDPVRHLAGPSDAAKDVIDSSLGSAEGFA